MSRREPGLHRADNSLEQLPTSRQAAGLPVGLFAPLYPSPPLPRIARWYGRCGQLPALYPITVSPIVPAVLRWTHPWRRHRPALQSEAIPANQRPRMRKELLTAVATHCKQAIESGIAFVSRHVAGYRPPIGCGRAARPRRCLAVIARRNNSRP